MIFKSFEINKINLNKNNFYHTDTRKKIIYKIRINNKLKILKKSVYKSLFSKLLNEFVPTSTIYIEQ